MKYPSAVLKRRGRCLSLGPTQRVPLCARREVRRPIMNARRSGSAHTQPFLLFSLQRHRHLRFSDFNGGPGGEPASRCTRRVEKKRLQRRQGRHKGFGRSYGTGSRCPATKATAEDVLHSSGGRVTRLKGALCRWRLFRV